MLGLLCSFESSKQLLLEGPRRSFLAALAVFGFMFPLVGRQHGEIFPWIRHDVDQNDQKTQRTMMMIQRVRII